MDHSLATLLTEAQNPDTGDLDQLSILELTAAINRADLEVPSAVGAQLSAIAALLTALVPRIEDGGRLFYIGAGTSGRLGVLDAAECPPTFNVPYEMMQGIIAGGERALAHATESSEDDPGAGWADLLARGFSAKDALIGIAASGRTPYVLGAVKAARDLGALTGCIVCVPDSAIAAAVEFPIAVLTGPEVLTGSTRMKAGTATKLVLNTISTALMVRLGYTYGNLMVNVRPSNAKLVDRAERIVALASGASPEEARDALREASMEVKTAIVTIRKAVSVEEARRMLEAEGGRLARVLHDEARNG